jgi:hypothetical protein
MSSTLSIESLEVRLSELEREKELIIQLIAIQKGEPLKDGRIASYAPRGGSNTIRGRVVDATIELIHKTDRHVTNEQVLGFVEEKKISLGNTADKVRAVGAILSQECDKKSARLKRVARGVYEIK